MNKIEETKELMEMKAETAGVILPNLSTVMNGTLKTRLLDIIKDNVALFKAIGVITPAFLNDNFAPWELTSSGVFVSGTHTTTCHRIIVCGDAVVQSLGETDSYCFDNAKLEGQGGTHRLYNYAELNLTDEAVVWAYNNSKVNAASHAVVIVHDQADVYNTDNVVIVRPTPQVSTKPPYKTVEEGKAHYRRLASQNWLMEDDF